MRGSSQPPAMNRPKKLTLRDGERELRDEVAQVRLVERALVAKDGFQQIELRPGQAGEPVRQLLRVGLEKRLRVELAAGEALQQPRHRGVDGVAAPFGAGDDLAVGRQVAHDVQVGPQALAVARVGGRPQEDRPGHDRVQGRELGGPGPGAGQLFDALLLGGTLPFADAWASPRDMIAVALEF